MFKGGPPLYSAPPSGPPLYSAPPSGPPLYGAPPLGGPAIKRGRGTPSRAMSLLPLLLLVIGAVAPQRPPPPRHDGAHRIINMIFNDQMDDTRESLLSDPFSLPRAVVGLGSESKYKRAWCQPGVLSTSVGLPFRETAPAQL